MIASIEDDNNKNNLSDMRDGTEPFIMKSCSNNGCKAECMDNPRQAPKGGKADTKDFHSCKILSQNSAFDVWLLQCYDTNTHEFL